MTYTSVRVELDGLFSLSSGAVQNVLDLVHVDVFL
jgi:hypothetical protein